MAILDHPKITIVTVVFNDIKNIASTIQSVINQDYPNFEYIIIDGCSTDGTVDLIKKYDDKVDYWISECDEGIYDAMNKGICVATGDWIVFMNSGDKFHNDNVLCDIDFRSIPNNIALVVGAARVISDWGVFQSIPKGSSEIWKNFVHQSLFSRIELARNYKFDRSYRAASDFNFVYSLFIKGYEIRTIPLVVSDILFSDSGFTSKNEVRSLFEVLLSVYRNRKGLKIFFFHFCYHAFSLFRKLLSIPIRIVFPLVIYQIRKKRDERRK